MIGMFDKLLEGITDPVVLFGHFTYSLLILSMLMRRMAWLRALAVASGLAKIIYRAFFVLDPVSVLWETMFVIVNVAQLLIIWYFDNHHRFDDEERHFVENMPASVERSSIKRLLQYSELVPFEANSALTREGEPVRDLMYIAEGVVKIERGGRIVAVCGPGDYIGELSFLTGAPATATAIVVKPVRVLAFEQVRLHAAIEHDAELRRALESTLNLNLVGKLVRSNAALPVEEQSIAP